MVIILANHIPTDLYVQRWFVCCSRLTGFSNEKGKKTFCMVVSRISGVLTVALALWCDELPSPGPTWGWHRLCIQGHEHTSPVVERWEGSCSYNKQRFLFCLQLFAERNLKCSWLLGGDQVLGVVMLRRKRKYRTENWLGHLKSFLLDFSFGQFLSFLLNK